MWVRIVQARMAERRVQAAKARLRTSRSKDMGSVCAIVGNRVQSWMGVFWIVLTRLLTGRTVSMGVGVKLW